MVGAVVSMVTERLLEAEETLPAASVCLAFIVARLASERAEEVMVTVLEEQAPEPTEVMLSYKVTVAPLSQEMAKSGVVSEVMLSVEEEPLSVPAVISGVPGAEGAVVSITKALLAAKPVVGVKSDIALPATSAMVPEMVASRSAEVSPETTV